MLTKILFTALVIVVVFAVARIRGQFVRSRPLPLAPLVARVPPPKVRSRATVYLVAGALVVSAVVGYYFFWSSWHEVVTVRVINARTGETVIYQVHKGSIHEREFETTDGWKVVVSDTERVEIKPRSLSDLGARSEGK